MKEETMYLRLKERSIWLSLIRASLRGGAHSEVALARADNLLDEYRRRCKPTPKTLAVAENLVLRVGTAIRSFNQEAVERVAKIALQVVKEQAPQSPDPNRPSKIRCIKYLRQETGLSLRESKAVMDAVFEHLGFPLRS